MYDTLTSHLLRLARRSIPVIVIVLALGAIAGALFSQRREQWSGTMFIDVSKAANAAQILQLGTTTDLTVEQLAIQSAEALNDSTETDAFVIATSDQRANIVGARATGPDEESVSTALDEFAVIVNQGATGPWQRDTSAAIASAEKVVEQFDADLEIIDGELASLDANDPSRDPLVLARIDAQTGRREASQRLEDLRAYQSLLGDDFVTVLSAETTPPAGWLTGAVIGVIGAGLVLLAAGGLLVVTDRKLRRRVQIERCAPATNVIAVVGRDPDGEEVVALARSIDVFCARQHADTASLVFLAGSDPGEWPSALQTTATVISAPDGLPPTQAAWILVVTWGASTEDELVSAVASMSAVSDMAGAVILTEVPRRDLAWAGVGAAVQTAEAS